MRERVEDIQLSIRRISEKAREQDECIRFDIGQPSFDTPQHVKEAAREKLEEKQGYTSVMGIESLREAIAEEERMKEGVGKKFPMSKENVMITVGGMGALYSILAAMTDKDKKALFNDPAWGPYKLMSKVNDNKFSQERYFDQNGDLRDEARAEIKESDLMVANSPGNPSGTMLTKQQAKTLGELSDDFDTFLISDEVYHRLTYGKKHYSPAVYAERSAIIGSMSKNHAMTGWRIGWVAGDNKDIQHFAKVTRGVSACPPKISQLASVEALKNDRHVERMRKKYGERRDLVEKRMNDLGWSFEKPEGAIYAFPEVGRDSWDFCLEMVEKGVAMVPGEPSGPKCDKNVRICFGSTTKQQIERAFDILEDEA